MSGGLQSLVLSPIAWKTNLLNIQVLSCVKWRLVFFICTRADQHRAVSLTYDLQSIDHRRAVGSLILSHRVHFFQPASPVINPVTHYHRSPEQYISHSAWFLISKRRLSVIQFCLLGLHNFRTIFFCPPLEISPPLWKQVEQTGPYLNVLSYISTYSTHHTTMGFIGFTVNDLMCNRKSYNSIPSILNLADKHQLLSYEPIPLTTQ